MESALLALAGSLQGSGIEGWARGTAWAYPAANVLHVIGAIMLVGAIGVVDLRIAGLWPRLPLPALSRALTPVAVAGLALQLGSGAVLFAADGEALARSSVFQLKLVLLALALANAAAFRWPWRRKRWDSDAPSAPARVSALASLGLWLAIVTAGRLIAYY